MKKTRLLQTMAILPVLVTFQSAAVAQQPVRTNERYCLEFYDVRGGTAPLLCRFETAAQCIASKTAPGDKCYLNPWLAFRQRG